MLDHLPAGMEEQVRRGYEAFRLRALPHDAAGLRGAICGRSCSRFFPHSRAECRAREVYNRRAGTWGGVEMGQKSDFLPGIVVGALTGIGLGILFAPQSGQVTRQRVRDRADEMGTRLRSSADDLTQRGRTAMDELTHRGRMAVDEG